MFGTKDDQADNSQMMAPPMPTADQPATYAPATDISAPTAPTVDPYAAQITQPTAAEPAQDTSPVMQPAYSGLDTSTPSTDVTTPASSANDGNDTVTNSASDVDHHGLYAIKQEALQHLSPMVHTLEQTPEEKFKTLMMMIQASDDHTKLKDAFEMAKQITDDKARAQALLDVINEINYFTQQNSQAA